MSVANRKRRIGQVISDKMDKTVVVAVQWRQRHPVYRKSIRRISKFHAHDEQNDARIGDRVLIVETKPLSRLKRWRIAEILERHEVPEIAPQEIGAAIEEEISQPEAAVAVADVLQAEEVDTAEPEAAGESEPETAEESESEATEESEPEVVEEPEPETAGESEPEATEEPEPEVAEESEPEAAEEPEPEVAEEPEPEVTEQPEPEPAEDSGHELGAPAEEATDVAEAVAPSADEAPSQDAPSTGQEPEAEVAAEEETGQTVEEREGKEGP